MDEKRLRSEPVANGSAGTTPFGRDAVITLIVSVRTSESTLAHVAADARSVEKASGDTRLAVLLGLFVAFRMTRLPDPKPSAAAEMALGG
jgi:hypothetical protein